MNRFEASVKYAAETIASIATNQTVSAEKRRRALWKLHVQIENEIKDTWTPEEKEAYRKDMEVWDNLKREPGQSAADVPLPGEPISDNRNTDWDDGD
jgi:hypothetical protein